MTEHFDAIVVGAGPAGNSAAYTMAKAGLNVLQIERGETPGSKNVQGAILYSHALERIIPDFREDAPLERPIVEQRLWMLDDNAYIGSTYRSEDFKKNPPNRYTIIRAEFDRWFSEKVKAAGALVLCETTVTALLRDAQGKVIGVTTDRVGGDVYADVVVLADGVNSLLAQQAGFRSEIDPKDAALAVKEVLFLAPDLIDQRFNINHEEGVVIEMVGKITKGMIGTGFMYTNRESITIGIGCMLSSFKEGGIPPYQLLEEMKHHPAIRPYLKEASSKEYSAHLIPEGGYKAIPKLYGDGWMLVGDSAGLVNAVHREGSNLAMTSGKLAAETIIDLKREDCEMNAYYLSIYHQRLNHSFVMADMKKYKNVPDVLHNRSHLFTTYPEMVSKAAMEMLYVDGKDKKTKQRKIVKEIRQQHGLLNMLTDAYKTWRAFR